MTLVHEDPAAAQTDPVEREVDGSPETGADHLADRLEILMRLDTEVLRALNEPAPAYVALPSAAATSRAVEVNLSLAKRAEPFLRALRSLIMEYRDGIVPLADDDARPYYAADALRDLLEIILQTPLTLPGEEKRTERSTEKEFADVLDRTVSLTAGPEKAREPAWTLKNQTAQTLTLTGRDGTAWKLPAYGSRAFPRDPRLELKIRDELARGEVQVDQDRAKPDALQTETLWLYVWIIPGAFIAGKAWGTWGWIAGAVALAVPVTMLLASAGFRNKERLRGLTSGLPALLMQVIAFLVVLAFCLVVPAVTIFYGADLKPAVDQIVDGKGTSDDYLTLVSRAMQVVLIAIASMLPALLYYQFDRDRMSTLRDKFVHQIFRLDPEMTTMGAIDAKYGRLIDEVYGPERFGRYRKLPRGRRAPIFVATVLIMLGWLLVLLNPDVSVVTDEATIANVFEPRPTAPAFAFLGAYFFTLFALLRGYVRRDLRPKSYSDISVRIIAVVILAWVVELPFADNTTGLLVFAFLVGIVPQIALTKIRELSQGFWRSRALDAASGAGSSDDGGLAAALADPLPLTDLEGIDLYDRTRLGSEGVTNIEGLAHHDLIELLLMTRIPVPRLVDWTDQAILYLHVVGDDRAKLRSYGIRTASDLIQAFDAAEKNGKPLAILDGDTERLAVIVDSLRDEAWMGSILSWHGALTPGGETVAAG